MKRETQLAIIMSTCLRAIKTFSLLFLFTFKACCWTFDSKISYTAIKAFSLGHRERQNVRTFSNGLDGFESFHLELPVTGSPSTNLNTRLSLIIINNYCWKIQVTSCSSIFEQPDLKDKTRLRLTSSKSMRFRSTSYLLKPMTGDIR